MKFNCVALHASAVLTVYIYVHHGNLSLAHLIAGLNPVVCYIQQLLARPVTSNSGNGDLRMILNLSLFKSFGSLIASSVAESGKNNTAYSVRSIYP